MVAKILHIDNRAVDNAVSLWRAGELVAIPTETVYGLAADASNSNAVAKIYAVKARPQFNPLIVHVADRAMAQRYARWTPVAERLADHFWPGPLTLVLTRKQSIISELVSAGGDTIALRMPSHPASLRLIEAFGGGIAAPSANRSGRISPTQAAHVMEELGQAILLIIDGGTCNVGLESTVIDASGDQAVILRPGTITRTQLEAVVPLADAPRAGGDALKSPGLLVSHYAPQLPVRLNAMEVGEDEALLAFGQPLSGAGAVKNLSEGGNLIEAAANFFAHLRALDDSRFRAIAVMPIPEEGVGEAINDRLRRAAADR